MLPTHTARFRCPLPGEPSCAAPAPDAALHLHVPVHPRDGPLSYSCSRPPCRTDVPMLALLDPERTVVVGREDYVVRSVQVRVRVKR